MVRSFGIDAARRRARVMRWNVFVALGVAACVAVGSADPASAYKRRSAENAESRQEKTVPKRTGPLFAVVSIEDQHVSFYGAEGLVERSPISTGMQGHRTPTGVFAIVQKQVFHRSNIYSSAPMPHMQRITWSGVAMHAGVLPGYAASHGCIRMPPSFAQRIYGMTKVGQRVLVSPHDIVPMDIVHANLPAPKLWPVQGEAQVNAGGNAGEQPAASQDWVAAQIKPAGEVEPAAMKVETPAAKRMNPIEYAWAMRTESAAKSKTSVQALKGVRAATSAKQEEARATTRSFKSAQGTAENIQSQIAAVARKMARMTSDDEASGKVMEAKTALEARLAEAQKALEDARQTKAAKDKELSEAWQAASKAESEGKEAESQAADELAAAKEDEARTAGKAIKAAEATAKTAEGQLAVASRRAARAQEDKTGNDAAKAKLAEVKSALEVKLAEVNKAVEEAKALKDANDAELGLAQKAEEDAESAVEAAVAAYKEATRRLEPVSILISRKTGRLYVRQGFASVFDAAVTIKDPEQLIGTHVYVSTEALDDGARLHWSALSMPDDVEKKPATHDKARRRSASNDDPVVTATMVLPAETAKSALDRIEIPKEVARRLSELTWIGASLTISDHAMSGETNESTDFVILTRSRLN